MMCYIFFLPSFFRDLKNYEAEPILKRLMCRDHEIVKLEIFRCGVVAVIVFRGWHLLTVKLRTGV